MEQKFHRLISLETTDRPPPHTSQEEDKGVKGKGNDKKTPGEPKVAQPPTPRASGEQIDTGAKSGGTISTAVDKNKEG